MKLALRLFAMLALLAPALATAQVIETTVREANAVAQSDIDFLVANSATLTEEQVDEHTHPEMEGEIVQFTAVILSDPYNSGNASWNDETNQPNRVHIFFRDTSAVTQGYEGMAGMIVDGSGLWNNVNVRKGRVYTIQAEVTTFNPGGGGVTIQYAPTAFEDLGPYEALGLPDEIMDPITVTTDDLTNVVAGGMMQANWATFNDYNGNYVRFEDAIVTDAAVGDNERVNYQWRSSGTDAVVNSGDISLRYRNDREGGDAYPNPPWHTRPNDDPFNPPAVGASINIQGFIVFPTFDFNSVGQPPSTFYSIHPMDDSDLEVVESPPVFGEVTLPEGVPGNAPVEVSVEVTPSGSRTITSVELDYEFLPSGTTGSVAMTDDGSGTYEGSIPTAPDGDFVAFTITATDSEGSSSTAGPLSYRVLYGGITAIAHIQQTADGQPGSSPFDGLTTTTQIDLDAVVMSDFIGVYSTGEGAVRILTLQDDDALGAWTGVHTVVPSEATVAVGDRITITGATVAENFGVTRLEDLDFTVTSSGAPYDAKVVPTGLLNGDDPGLQEAHEGMLIRFEDVFVYEVNADAPSGNFGEFSVSSDDTEANAVRVDDMSEAIPSDFNVTNLNEGATISYVQGPWYFSFGNYKLTPPSLDDIGAIVLDVEQAGPGVPGTYRLGAAYPNPFNPTATIRFEVGAAGPATLRVYDALGREVATLVDGTLSPGVYEATFDARGLASGVYVYRLAAGDQVLTGRMTLLK